MKRFLHIILVLSPVWCFGQNISNKEVSSETVKMNKKAGKQAIQAHFNVPTIAVYQDNAEAKIKDLYSYFQLLSGNESEAFKNQVSETIRNLFRNTSIAMDNIVLESGAKITLDAFLNQLKTSKHTFQFLGIEKKSIQENSFVFSYTVLVNAQKKTIQQQVFFYPVQKQFGNKTKEVWEYTLGSLQM